MSLYIGNLSARTRRDELERVFRRFGQCEVRLKDGYGFVVYAFAPQAEKALKVLQGRNIGGQQLNMMWSKQQPIPVKRNARGNRQHEPHGRDLARRMIPRHNTEGVGEEAMNFIGDDFSRDVDDHEPEIVDNGRWGERVDNGDVDSDGIDRYEPYHGYDRRLEESSPDNVRRERDRFRKNCFSCGGLGHKARDCPEKQSSRRRFDRFDHRRSDSEIERSRNRNGGASNSGQLQSTRMNRNSIEIDKKGKRSEREFRKKSDSVSSRSEYSASRSHSALKSSKSRARSSSSSPTSLSLSSSPQLNRKPLPEDVHTQQHKNPKENNAYSKNPVFGTDGGARMGEIPKADNLTAKPGFVESLSSINHGGPASLSLEEMRVAMKHFGVELPQESKHLGTLEDLFGSARLWPWEGIYYRRVKKGPISVENYARRVEQNREFGIVDKYVRSSSGWGE